jgi:hypothetical protein
MQEIKYTTLPEGKCITANLVLTTRTDLSVDDCKDLCDLVPECKAICTVRVNEDRFCYGSSADDMTQGYETGSFYRSYLKTTFLPPRAPACEEKTWIWTSIGILIAICVLGFVLHVHPLHASNYTYAIV